MTKKCLNCGKMFYDKNEKDRYFCCETCKRNYEREANCILVSKSKMKKYRNENFDKDVSEAIHSGVSYGKMMEKRFIEQNRMKRT